MDGSADTNTFFIFLSSTAPFTDLARILFSNRHALKFHRALRLLSELCLTFFENLFWGALCSNINILFHEALPSGNQLESYLNAKRILHDILTQSYGKACCRKWRSISFLNRPICSLFPARASIPMCALWGSTEGNLLIFYMPTFGTKARTG